MASFRSATSPWSPTDAETPATSRGVRVRELFEENAISKETYWIC
jgi:hypothetical protein